MDYSFDKSIKYYRKKSGIRQSDMAAELGLKIYQLSFIENKLIYPEMEMAEKIAGVLKVTIGQLYNEEELNFLLIKGGIKHDV